MSVRRARKPRVTWTFLVQDGEGAYRQMECRRCKVRAPLDCPMYVSELVEATEKFNAEHAGCVEAHS